MDDGWDIRPVAKRVEVPEKLCVPGLEIIIHRLHSQESIRARVADPPCAQYGGLRVLEHNGLDYVHPNTFYACRGVEILGGPCAECEDERVTAEDYLCRRCRTVLEQI